MLIAAIDVGSPAKIGWATSRNESGCGHLDPLIDIVAAQLASGKKVALGFEAPCWIPRGRPLNRITANRGGIEARMSRPWSAGAGCGSLAAGIANAAWVFEALLSRCGAVTATVRPDSLLTGKADLLVWEAFVSGKLKAVTHEGDAELAVAAFQSAWPHVVTAVEEEAAVNLLAASLLATGHQIGADEVGQPGVVVAALEA